MGRDIDATIAENDLRESAERRLYTGRALLGLAALGWLAAVGHLANLVFISYDEVDDWTKADWGVLLGVPLVVLPLAVAGVGLMAAGSVTLRLRAHERHVRRLSEPPTGIERLGTERCTRRTADTAQSPA